MKTYRFLVLFVLMIVLSGCTVRQNPPMPQQAAVCAGPAEAAPKDGCYTPGRWQWNCQQWQCIVPVPQAQVYVPSAPAFGFTYGPGYWAPVVLQPPASFIFRFGGGGGHHRHRGGGRRR